MSVYKESNGQWWITMPACEDCGPYDTKKEAEEDMHGMERFYKHHQEKGFITSEQ